MVGAALSVLGILTPLPWYIFVPLGAALIFYGRKLGTKAGEAKIEESAEQEENEAQEIRKPEMLFHCLMLTLLSLSLDMELSRLLMLIREEIFLTELS